MSAFTPMPQAAQPRARSGVFVSYARADGEAQAAALRERIAGRGIPVWHDRTAMEGGRDWWEQIKQALAHVEYMVLVMTPAAVRSETVRREWRHARQQGVGVYPVIAAPGIDIGLLPRWMGSVHWYDLAHQEEKFFNDLNTRCRLQRVPFMAEPLPPDFVTRPQEFDRLKALLLSADRQEPVAVTAALRGAGGYGKTTLARALCADEDIQNAFDDGILWVTLGEAPGGAALLGKLGDLIETLSGERPAFDGLDAAATRLRELLADRDILLVVDDVWRAADLRPFLGGGTRCARLVTTRRADAAPDAVGVPVGEMQPGEALALLDAGIAPGQEAALCALARRLGHWPLLLKLGRRWLRKRIDGAGQPVDAALRAFGQALDKRGLKAFDAANAGERNDAAAATLELSLEGLAQADRDRLQELAVFPEDLDIPLAVLERLWGTDAWEVEETAQRLHDESLVVEYSLQERFVRLHDAVRAWLIGRAGGAALAACHGRLLAAYRRAGGTPWHAVEDDGYLHVHLPLHLAAAGRPDELRGLLLDLDWMAVRLAAGARARVAADAFGLVSAYEGQVADEELAFIGRALKMSSHVLGTAPSELAAQLYGRLAGSVLPGVRALWQQAQARLAPRPLRPLCPALAPPGSLTRTLGGHAGAVLGAFLLHDGRQVLSWSDDGTLRLWDLARGETLRSFACHRQPLMGAALLGGERQALSWSEDGTLALWDLQREAPLHRLAGHTATVLGASVLDEGRKALSWSRDRTLRLWDLEGGRPLFGLDGHQDTVGGALVMDDGRRVLSWSNDGSLRSWCLERGIPLQTFTRHPGRVLGALPVQQGRRVLSWSDDGTLQLCDIETGVRVHRYATRRSAILGMRLLAGGERVLSWSAGGDLALWSFDSREPLRCWHAHDGWVVGARLLAGEREVLSWSRGHGLAVSDLESGQPAGAFDGHTGDVRGAALVAQGRQVLSWSADRTLRLWDFESRRPLRTLRGHSRAVRGGVMLPAGSQVLSWSYDGTLKLWDLSRDDTPELPGHQGRAWGAVPLPGDGARVLSWSADGTLKLWGADGAPMHTLRGQAGQVWDASVSADGRRALSWSEAGHLQLWDLEQPAPMAGMPHGCAIRGALWWAQGRQALSWSDDTLLRLWDLGSGRLLHELDGHTRLPEGALPLDGGRQALSWSADGMLKLWDLQRGVLLHDLPNGGVVQGVHLLDAGRRALAWSGTGELKVWDLEEGRLLHTLAGSRRGRIAGVELLDGGGRALSWSTDGLFRLWDLEAGALLQDLQDGHADRFSRVCVLDGGRRALAWSLHGAVCLWSLQEGRLVHRLAGAEGIVSDIRAVAGGRALSWSVGSSSSLRIWDLASGQLLHDLPGHGGAVFDVRILAAGRFALSWSEDATIRLWDLAAGRQVDAYFSDTAFAPAAVVVLGDRLMAFDAAGARHLLVLPGAAR